MENRTNSRAEEHAKKALTLKIFSGFSLDNAKEKLASLLSHIGDNDMFSEYTKHDISHVNGMLFLLDFIIPEKTQSIMTPTDWMLIVLACYFHDLGMLITQHEFDERSKNHHFDKYKSAIDYSKYSKLSDEKREKYLYQDYVRDNHGNRIETLLIDIANKRDSDNPIVTVLRDVLCNIDSDFLKDLGKVCKSHSEPFETVANFDIQKPYEQARESEVNLLFASAILRTADLLHVNSERTPDVDFTLISPQNSYSRREWVKQKSVKQIRPKSEKSPNGHIDRNIQPHQFEVIASFTDEDAYSHFMDYLLYAEEEIKRSFQICKSSYEANQNDYLFPWDGISRERIVTEGFNAEKLKFELDQDNILKLLIGHTLYNQANVVLRELAQNAIDACRLMNHNSKSGSEEYQPEIRIEWDKENHILKVADNGTGMNEDIIKKYLLKVGSSRYQSQEFKEKNRNFHSISRFGIGLLTCFMISDNFEVITLWHEENKAHRLKIKNLQGEYMLRNDVEPIEILGGYHGTTFILNVHENIDLSNIVEDLSRWVIIPDCKVVVVEAGTETSIGYQSNENALKVFLEKSKIIVDDNQYKFFKKTNEELNIEACFLLRKHPLYENNWSLYNPSNDLLNDRNAPIGICIEGILVSNSTPGFHGRNYIALVNCKGSKSPKTNVARDDLEYSEEQKDLLKFVYNSYLEIAGNQIGHLSEKYSLSWALNETQRNIANIVRQRNYQDKELFNEVLYTYKCNLVDTGDKYINKSISDFGEEIWTIESKAYSAAERLIQEIKNCDKTALSLFQSLDTEFKSNNRTVFSETSARRHTMDLFFKKYEVVDICISTNSRRIELCWHKGNARWEKIMGDSTYSYHSFPNMFLPKDLSNIKQNTNNCDIVVSRYGMFFVSNHPLCELLLSMLKNNTPNRVHASGIITGYIHSLNRKRERYSEKNFKKFFDSNENYLGNDIWNCVDRSSLKEAFNSSNLSFLDFNIYYLQQD